MSYKLGLLSTIAFCLLSGCTINVDPPVNLVANVYACAEINVLDAEITNCPDAGPMTKDGNAD